MGFGGSSWGLAAAGSCASRKAMRIWAPIMGSSLAAGAHWAAIEEGAAATMNVASRRLGVRWCWRRGRGSDRESLGL